MGAGHTNQEQGLDIVEQDSRCRMQLRPKLSGSGAAKLCPIGFKLCEAHY